METIHGKTKGLGLAGFGVSIMVLTGLEANLDESNGCIKCRTGHYLDITNKMGVDVSGEKLNTIGMHPFLLQGCWPIKFEFLPIRFVITQLSFER